MGRTVKEIAGEWYEKLEFPPEFDEEFGRLLRAAPDSCAKSFAEYASVSGEEDPGQNLIMLLWFCEELEAEYRKRGIPEKVLLDTVADIKISVGRFYDREERLGLQSLRGFAPYFSMELFRLGRLQFCMTGAPRDIPERNIRKGDSIVDIHIPKGTPLLPGECKKSIGYADAFFRKFFPEYSYRHYLCFSWLLDEGLQRFLDERSNIIRFQKMFDVVYKRQEDSILHFMFRFGFRDREELRDWVPRSGFAEAVKEYALSGGVFYNALGVLRKDI